MLLYYGDPMLKLPTGWRKLVPTPRVTAGRTFWGSAALPGFILTALVAAFLAFGATQPPNVALAHTPDCPSTVPTTAGEFFWTDSNGDRWFVIRQSESSGYTTVQAYVASEDYDGGYVPSSPHETCVLKVRGPDDDEDLDPPVQIFFASDDDDSEDEPTGTTTTGTTTGTTGTGTGTNTPGNTQQPSATFTLTPSTGDTDNPTLATVGFATFAYEGTAVTIVIALSNLNPDSDSQTTDYYYRVRVVQGSTVNLLCQGAGMNTIRSLNTNTGSSIQTATIPGTCPVGTYAIEVELASSDDPSISNPIAEGTSYLVIGPVPGSQNTGQTGGSSGGQNGQGDGQGSQGSNRNQGGGSGGIIRIIQGPGPGHGPGDGGQGGNNGGQGGNNGGQGGNNGGQDNGQGGGQCGKADRGSSGTPDRPAAPTLILTQDTTQVGVQWVAPNDNGSAIIGYSIMVVPEGGTRRLIDAGGQSEVVQNLVANTEHEIRVSACNSVGPSNWSQGATIQTVATHGTNGGNIIGNGNNNNNGNANNGGNGGSNGGHYEIVVLGTCPSGGWAGHTHTNTINYLGGTDCVEKRLIDEIDPTTRSRMWTKQRMDDHKHEGFSDADYQYAGGDGNSCNSKHVAAHASHTVLTGCGSQ